MKQAYDTS